MMFCDLDSEHTYTLSEIYSEWKELKTEDPWNHSKHFMIEMFELLMATINGRNNLEIVGMMPREVNRLIIRIRTRLDKSDY